MRIRKIDIKLNRSLPDTYLELRYDHRRRLRNALLALALSDPAWMVWVEREINPRWKLERIMRLVEARARILIFQHYVDFKRSRFYFSDQPFNDKGCLIPG